MIAGVRGGSGKTTLSLGLIAALGSRKGLKVVPYKKGPDYIDAGWMSVAAKNPCYTLDSFLIPKEKTRESFLSHFSGDIAVIEGNRGLHDGMDAAGSYSTAELAKLLKAPVILIVDCTKMTRTAAAVVLGCMNLDRDASLRGVVLNQVAGDRHESVIRESIERYCSLPVLGAIPRLPSEELPERHMGLTPHQEHPGTERVIASVEDIAARYLDLDRIREIAESAEPLPGIGGDADASRSLASPCPLPEEGCTVVIGVIRDSAFQFYYPENLEDLERRGAKLIDIDALSDSRLPDVDALYIGGGFPETNALRLAENEDFRQSVRAMAERGLPIYAECGGLMFLGDSLTVEGRKYPMVGLFPLAFEMKERPQAHGYTVVEVERENPFFPVGTVLQGHEFHYSAVAAVKGPEEMPLAFRMQRGQGIREKKDGIVYKNVFATYTHTHALGAAAWGEGMIARAKAFRESRGLPPLSVKGGRRER